MTVLKISGLRKAQNETEDIRKQAIFGALNQAQKKGQLFG